MGSSKESAAAPPPPSAAPKRGRLTFDDSSDDDNSGDDPTKAEDRAEDRGRAGNDAENKDEDEPMLPASTRSSSSSSSSSPLDEVEEQERARDASTRVSSPFPSSSSSLSSGRGVTTTTMMPVVTPSASSSAKQAVEAFSPELLHQYYSRLFPFDFVYSWLSYGSPAVFSRREFSMTIEPAPGEEIYIRYQSFSTQKELADAVLRRRPVKIDLGAVFSHPPKDHKSVPAGAFLPLQRELVFDVDLTDYDSIRACGCSGARICAKCWSFMKTAVKVVDQGLREDFGFEHVAWFYSGRRGVHCWVCDESARELTDAGRSAVASYFEVQLASETNKDVQLSWPLHPMLERAYRHLEPVFVRDVIPDHKLLSTPEQWNALLDSLPESAKPVQDHLREEWNGSARKKAKASTPAEKWLTLQKHLGAFLKTSKPSGSAKHARTLNSWDAARVEAFCPTLVFTYTYPRLDVNVSKMRNHLLKSPFCVHPKTGRVCVPFAASEVDEFDPFQVPTLGQLVREVDDYDRSVAASAASAGDENAAVAVTCDWQKTSLRPYFDKFRSGFLEPLLRENRQRQSRAGRDARERTAALAGDF